MTSNIYPMRFHLFQFFSLSLTDIVPSVYVQVALSSGVKNFTANVEVDDVEVSFVI